jgi:hypothetical protein
MTHGLAGLLKSGLGSLSWRQIGPLRPIWMGFSLCESECYFLRISRSNGDAPMPIDPRELLPRSKRDLGAARAVIALGYPAVAPVLPDLLEWLQDYNWPVSRPISDFLASIPEPTAPHIREVLEGNDLIWKYWCIHVLISRMPKEIAEQFRPDLIRLAEHPTSAERIEELDEVAKEAIEMLWPSGDERSTPEANRTDG